MIRTYATIESVLNVCKKLSKITGYTFCYSFNTTTDEFKVTIYYHEPSMSLRNIIYKVKLDIESDQFTEDLAHVHNHIEYLIETEKATEGNQ